jgi:hypothetical protein
VSLVAGRQDTGFASDFSSFSAKIEALSQELRARFPFLDVQEGKMLHVTLVCLQLSMQQVSAARAAFVARDHKDFLRRMVAMTGSRRRSVLDFRGLNLMPDGVLIIEGHALNDELFRMRERAKDMFPDSPAKEIASITLGRLARQPTPQEWNDLIAWVAERRNLEFGKATLKNSILVAMSNYSGSQLDEEVQSDLQEVNQALVEQGAAQVPGYFINGVLFTGLAVGLAVVLAGVRRSAQETASSISEKYASTAA